MTDASTPFSAEQLSIVPANEAPWDDLQAIFGTKDAGLYLCQRLKVRGGLVAYADGEPVGWVAVQPRTAYPKLTGSPVPWKGRTEDKADDGV